MPAPTSADARDHLQLDGVRFKMEYPMLTECMRSRAFQIDMLLVAREIERRWRTKVSHDTGNLASTGASRSIKGRGQRGGARAGWRWEAMFTAGGSRAPYAPEMEAEEHALADVLTEMGYGVGDRLWI